MTSEAFRTAVAAGCILGATLIHYSGELAFVIGVVVWLLLAMGAGFMKPTGWLLLAAPVPWLVGVGGGMLTGQHDSLGEVWLLPALLSTAAGLIGVIFGVAARKGNSRTKIEQESD